MESVHGNSSISEEASKLYADLLRHEPPEYFENMRSDPEWKKILFSIANRGLDDEQKRTAFVTAQLFAKFRIRVG